MPFTVTYDGAGIKQFEFDIYIRLLNDRGIVWTEANRIPEPNSDRRWVYVWEGEEEAQSFCDELSQSTHNSNWIVQELDTSTSLSPLGPLMPLIIRRTHQSLGSTFSLHPHSRTAIHRYHPKAQQSHSIFIEHETQYDFQQSYGSVWDQVAMMLSGLSMEDINNLGGYQILDPTNDSTVYNSPDAHLVE